MASNYTRYIEFKVKGRELTQAVDRIFKGVTKIEVSVEKQEKKWEKVRQGIGYVNKEVKKVNRELNNTEKALAKLVTLKKKLSDPQGIAKSFVSGAFGALLNNPGKIAKLVAKLGVADAAVRTLNGRTKGLGQTLLDLGKKVLSTRTALEGYSQTLDRIIRQHPQATAGAIGLAGGLGVVAAYSPQVYNLGKAFRQLTADIAAVDKAGRSGGIKNILRLFPSGSILGGIGRSGDIKGLKFKDLEKEQKKLEKSAEKTAYKYKAAATGLSKLKEQLDKSRRIQDKLLAGSDRYLKIAKNTLNIEKQIAKEEQKRANINRRLTWGKDLAKALGGQMGIAKLGAGAAGGIAGLVGIDKVIRKVSEALGQQIGLYTAVTKGSTSFFKGLEAVKKAAGGALASIDQYGRQIFNLVATHQRLIQSTIGVIGGLDAVARFTPQIYNAGRAWRQLEYDIRRVGKAFADSGFRGVAKLFPKGSYIGKWGRENEQEFAGDKAYKGIQKEWRKMGEHPGNIRSQVDGLSKVNKVLENNKKIQENINAFTKRHVQAVIATRKAQTAVNHELLRAKATQAIFTADIWAAKRAWTGLVGIVKGAAGIFGGILGGKAGKLGQAAGVIAISRAVEQLAKFIPFLDQAWKNNIQVFATWTKRITEGVAAVSIAYTGLTTILSGAQWVQGAVSGFVAWEKQAANSIWNVSRQVKDLSNLLAAAAKFRFNPFGKGGALRDALQGGKDRVIDKEVASRGPSDQQRLVKDIARQKRLRDTLNVSSSEYIPIQQKIIALEKELNHETLRRQGIYDKLIDKQYKAGKSMSIYTQQIKRNIAASKKSRKDSGFSDFSTKTETNRAIEGALRRKNIQLERAGKEQIVLKTKALNEEKKLAAAAEKTALAEKKKVWELRKAVRIKRVMRKREAAETRSRFTENMMLGAGFPLLFGGGAGAVGGGVLGAGIQAGMGSKGFGMQIFFSAIGQQIDAFVAKIGEVGKAFNKHTPNVEALISAMGVSGTALEKQMKLYKQAAGDEAALAMATEQMTRIIGAKGVKALKEYGEASTQWGNAFSQAMLRIQAAVAGFLSWSGLLSSKGGAEGRLKQTIKRGDNKEINELQARINAIKESATGRLSQPKQNEINRLKREQLEIQIKILDVQNVEKVTAAQTTELVKAQVASLKEQRQIFEDTLLYGTREAGIQSEIAQRVKEITDAKGKITDIQRQQIENEVRLNKQLEEAAALYTQVENAIKDGIVNALEGAIDKTKTLGEVAASVFRQISRMLLNYAVTSAFNQLMPKPRPRAAGGPVTGGESYLVGEKGPEIFTPGKSGGITPNNQLGGTSNVTINVDAGGSSMQGDAEQAGQLGRMLAAAVQDEMARQKRPGGILY